MTHSNVQNFPYDHKQLFVSLEKKKFRIFFVVVKNISLNPHWFQSTWDFTLCHIWGFSINYWQVLLSLTPLPDEGNFVFKNLQWMYTTSYFKSAWFQASHLQGKKIDRWPLKRGQISCSETWVRNYQFSLRNDPERRKCHITEI